MVSGYDYIGDTSDETVTFGRIQNCINWEYPVIGLQIRNEGTEDESKHAVGCFGYYTVGGRKQVIIANGWTRAWVFQGFDTLNLFAYTYARWN